MGVGGEREVGERWGGGGRKIKPTATQNAAKREGKKRRERGGKKREKRKAAGWPLRSETGDESERRRHTRSATPEPKQREKQEEGGTGVTVPPGASRSQKSPGRGAQGRERSPGSRRGCSEGDGRVPRPKRSQYGDGGPANGGFVGHRGGRRSLASIFRWSSGLERKARFKEEEEEEEGGGEVE